MKHFVTVPIQVVITIGVIMLLVFGMMMVVIFRKKTVHHKENILNVLSSDNSFNTHALYTSILGNSMFNTYAQRDKTAMQKVFDCVDKKVKNLDLHPADMVIDQYKPLVSIHDKYPDLYKALADCGFLNMVGNEISFPMWYMNTIEKIATGKMNSNDVQKSLENLTSCTNKLGDFSDIKIWSNVNDPKGPIKQCLNL